jgi:hypothetical protein
MWDPRGLHGRQNAAALVGSHFRFFFRGALNDDVRLGSRLWVMWLKPTDAQVAVD